MNIQEYISSGIVESYVLGLASEEERKEFEQYCIQYPELLKARTAFELSLEQQAMANAIVPAPAVKSKIMEAIGQTATVINMNSAPVRKMNGWKYAAAACIALLAGSIYFNIILTGRNSQLRNNYDQTLAELNTVKKDIDMLKGNPDIKMASMKGTDMAPAAFTTVYWDTTSHDVYLLVNNLPQPADSLQYQLWALANGKPVDLGFINEEYFVKQDRLLLKAKNAQSAQAFAITLEKKGRKNISQPEGQIYVLGNLQ